MTEQGAQLINVLNTKCIVLWCYAWWIISQSLIAWFKLPDTKLYIGFSQ